MGEGDNRGDGHAAGDDLEQAQPEDILLHPPQARGIEFEPDDEQQERDAQFGKIDLALRIAHQPEHLRTDHCARQQIAESGPEAEAAEQQHAGQREAHQHHAFVEKRHLVGFVHRACQTFSVAGPLS